MWLRAEVILVACLMGQLVHARTTDCVFVEGVTFATPVWPPVPGLLEDESMAYGPDLVKIHQLSPGPKTAVLLRSYSAGPANTVDGAFYWKFTAVIPDLLIGSRYEVRLDSMSTRVSYGGSAWINKASGFLGTSVGGMMRVDRSSQETVRLAIDAKFATQFAAEPKERGAFKLSGTYVLVKLPFESLTPWMGSREEADWEATHRPKKLLSNCIVESEEIIRN